MAKNLVFGKAAGQVSKDGDFTIARPMTLNQAATMIKDLEGSPKVIYRLVPLATFTKPKRKTKE